MFIILSISNGVNLNFYFHFLWFGHIIQTLEHSQNREPDKVLDKSLYRYNLAVYLDLNQTYFLFFSRHK